MKERAPLLVLLASCSVLSHAFHLHPFETLPSVSVSLGCTTAPPSATLVANRGLRNHSQPLISNGTSTYVESLMEEWNSTGLSLAVFKRDETVTDPAHPGWRVEFGSYGTTSISTGEPITPDTLFAIASNSKLFLSISMGLLISNKTLTEEFSQRHDVELGWKTKLVDVLGPELWKLWDEDIQRGATVEDLLVHRTGLPRHDYSGFQWAGNVREMISKLRYLRPSATFRDTFQYNNLMYETLSYLPVALLGQSYESYVAQHIFEPLNMSSSTFSIAEAEKSGQFAKGHLASDRDFTRGLNGTIKPIVPTWFRPGQERVWAGAGGVISSARDLVTWNAMLLNEGKHPYTNKTVVPKEVIEYVTTGRMVMVGKGQFPDTSPLMYGAAQFVYSYRGVPILEHGGNNPGFKSQVTRVPDHNLGIVSLSNNGETGGFVLEAAKWRVIDELVFGGGENGEEGYVDWSSRYRELWDAYKTQKRDAALPPPTPRQSPTKPFEELGRKKFSHGTYGELVPCLVPGTLSLYPADSGIDGLQHAENAQQPLLATSFVENPHINCSFVLAQRSTRRVLNAAFNPDVDTPTTYIIPFPRVLSTHLLLRHWSGNLFNVTVVWNNADVRKKEGYHSDDGDLVIGLDESFTVEWAHPNDESNRLQGSGQEQEGLAFKGGFWGQEGPDAKEPTGEGREGAEVWFALDV